MESSILSMAQSDAQKPQPFRIAQLHLIRKVIEDWAAEIPFPL